MGDNSNPYDGNLTFVGHVLASLPVDIRIGKLLVLGHVFGVLEECLIIGKSMVDNLLCSMVLDKFIVTVNIDVKDTLCSLLEVCFAQHSLYSSVADCGQNLGSVFLAEEVQLYSVLWSLDSCFAVQ